MSLILRIESGQDEGKTLTLEQGQAIRIGRDARADCSMPHDPFLSRFHCELRFDGRFCTLQDLSSSNGTTVRGSRINQVELIAGERFIAGQTEFVLISGPSLPNSGELTETDLPFDTPMKERLLREMRNNLQPLYAVLDAARSSRIIATLAQHKCEYVSLFDTNQAPELVRFAPYLVALPPESAALEPLVELGWSKDWGIYLTGASAGSGLIGFLQRLLISTLPDGQQVLLRFYDPRVLRVLLSNAAPQQLPNFFGPVHSYLMAGEKPQMAVGFTVSGQGLERYDIPLAAEQRIAKDVVSPPSTSSNPHGGLLLSDQQVAECKSRERDAFAEKLFSEVQKRFVERCTKLGETQVKSWIRYGCSRAKRYGLQTEPSMHDYVFLMMQLGHDFDQDPELPWASDLLLRRLAPPEKLARLKEAASRLSHKGF